MLNYFDVIKAQSGVPVKDIWAQLWGNIMSTEYVITTYTGTLPATLTGTKAGYLHRYKIYGNLTQNGTLTPSDPIYPSECGEKTENLFDKNANDTANGYAEGKVLQPNGTSPPVSGQEHYSTTEYIEIPNGATNLTLVKNSPSNVSGICFYDANKEYISGTSNKSNIIPAVISCPTGAVYFRTVISKQYINGAMVVSGSTVPTSYIPYGYKLPILSNSTVTNIYLGEVETTRRIKKLVLTGEETISGMADANDGAKAVSYMYSALGMSDIIDNEKYMRTIPYPIYLSSHFKEKTSGYSSWYDINAGEIGANSVGSNTINKYLIFGTNEQTQADFKAYLAQQYANGTPVTVWYVLATEETGTLNEPLRKIGNYADTIDSTQTTAQIPTSAGSTTISWAGEGLAPSQVELKYEKRR